MSLLYNEFVYQLKEGLITTHDITRYNSVIIDYLEDLEIKNKINIVNKFEFKVELETNDFEIIELLNHRCYVLGYFPAKFWIILENGMMNTFKEINDIPENTKYVIIRYESKYDDGLYKNTVVCPKTLYHYSYQENKDNIFKIGIYPKSKRRTSNHPERIYLFDDISEKDILLKNLKKSDIINEINKNYILLEIDCSEKDLILHTDPKYISGYFTYDNISPKNIKILKENL